MHYDDIDKDEAAKKVFDQINHITLVNEWSDDHVPCATVKIELYDGTVHEKVEFAYIGSGGVAAITYYEHPRAQLDFFNNNIPQIIDSAIDDGFDYVNTLKFEGKADAKAMDMDTSRLILGLAGLDIDEFETE